MRFAGKLFGKSDAVDQLINPLTIDSSKIRRELGWEPPYTMEQGLKETGGNGLRRSYEFWVGLRRAADGDLWLTSLQCRHRLLV